MVVIERRNCDLCKTRKRRRGRGEGPRGGIARAVEGKRIGGVEGGHCGEVFGERGAGRIRRAGKMV